MKTTDEMLIYVLENGFGVVAKKEDRNFVLIEQALHDDEVVMVAFAGLLNFVSQKEHSSSYAFAITNKRLIMAQKGIFNVNIQTILMKHITNITFSSNTKYGTITFSTLNDVFSVELEKRQAINLNDTIQRVIMELNNTSNATENLNSDSAPSPIEEIKKLKELLDLGAINEREYEEKKQELLARV